MTYNFDPQQWYDREVRMLDRMLERGEFDVQAHSAAVEDLDRRYDQMVDRLDGTYRIQSSPKSG
jgi:hypothetical protein